MAPTANESVTGLCTAARRTQKDALFLACKDKRCCSWYSVTLSGADVYRIWDATSLEPAAFSVYAAARDSSDTWFLLEPQGKRYQLMLAKREPADSGWSPCVFLWRLPDGHAQCGLDDLRPAVCKTYPLLLVDGLLCTGDRSGCTCSLPTLVNRDRDEEIRRLREAEHESAEYRDVLRIWNERVNSAPGRGFTFIEFTTWLVETYADRNR